MFSGNDYESLEENANTSPKLYGGLGLLSGCTANGTYKEAYHLNIMAIRLRTAHHTAELH